MFLILNHASHGARNISRSSVLSQTDRDFQSNTVCKIYSECDDWSWDDAAATKTFLSCGPTGFVFYVEPCAGFAKTVGGFAKTNDTGERFVQAHVKL